MIWVKELYARGIAHMSVGLLKKAVFAKEASREYQCQNLLTTAWKIEELRRHLDLMEGVQEENKGNFAEASTKLEVLESFLLEQPTSKIKAEHERLLLSYDQELLGLSTTDRQLDRLVRKLPDAVVEGKGKSVEKL